jgi:hypothetical protein
MKRVDEAIAAEADGFASFVEQREEKRFERFRIATRDGVAVAFYRRVDSTPSRGTRRCSRCCSMRNRPDGGRR